MNSFPGYLVILFVFLTNVVFTRIIPTLPVYVNAFAYFLDLEVSPDPSKPLLNGSVSIGIELYEDTDEIYLNSQNLTILRVIIGAEKPLPATFDQINDYTLKVKSPKKLEKAIYKLTIEYRLEDTNPGGIVRESYNDTDGKIRYVVSTQGEEFTASRYVPCFDEISIKSLWYATIRHEAKYTALTNGDLIERKDLGNGLVASTFQETPFMSSYLFTICVSEFEHVTTTSKDGVRLSVWMKPQEMIESNGTQVLHNLKHSFEYLSSILRPRYALPKIDVFFAPWIGNAMENWGLITGMMNAFPNALQHELSHQWFGDLVTAKSWDHYWLNEGFANYWEQKNFPNETINIIKQRQFTNGVDKTNQSYPIVAPHFNEVGPGPARYSKGGSLLYMLEGLVGRENLWMIMNKYLNEHALRSVVTSDFFDAFVPFFKAQKGDLRLINITEFGVEWTTQPGYPIVRVESDSEGGNYILTQKSSAGNNQTWVIPLFLTDFKECKEGAYKLEIFQKDWFEFVFLEENNFPMLFLLNSGYGLYQVDYDLETFTYNLKVFDQKNKCPHHETAKLQFLVDGLLSDNEEIRAKAKSYGQKYFPGLGIFDDEGSKPLDPHFHAKHFKFF